MHASTHSIAYIALYAGMALLSAGCAVLALLKAIPPAWATIGPALVLFHILHTLPVWMTGAPPQALRRKGSA